MSNFLRITEVMKKTSIARSTIWLWVSENKFSKPIKLSPRITVWEEEKINYWMKENYKMIYDIITIMKKEEILNKG
jgi:prophage regulatory protein